MVLASRIRVNPVDVHPQYSDTLSRFIRAVLEARGERLEGLKKPEVFVTIVTVVGIVGLDRLEKPEGYGAGMFFLHFSRALDIMTKPRRTERI
jgi:hypothetical protein